MYVLFAEDFYFLPPRYSGLEQDSAAGLYEEPGLSPTECKLQPRLDQLHGLLSGVPLCGSPVGALRFLHAPAPPGKAPYSLPLCPMGSAGTVQGVESFSCLQLQGLPCAGLLWGCLVCRANPPAEAGAPQAALLASVFTALSILFLLAEWSVLYVIIASFVIVVALGILSWTVICCCKR